MSSPLSTENEVIDSAKRALAEKLGALFHPELMTGLLSDTESKQVAELINTLIERHCMAVIMGIATGTYPK